VDTAQIVAETIAGKRKIEEVVMARAKVQDGQDLLPINGAIWWHKVF
jgi:hypothetical protein